MAVRSGPPVRDAAISREDQRRIGELCAELEKADVNPYAWLGEKRRQFVPASVLIRVLELAVRQQPGATCFRQFAEEQFEEICSESDTGAGTPNLTVMP